MSIFRRNKATDSSFSAGPSGDCTTHSPCRELLAMPAAERDGLLRLIMAKTSELGPDAISVYLNDELSARLVVMAAGDSGRYQRAYPVLAHLTSRWGVTPPDLLLRAVENMRRDNVEVNAHDQGENSPLYTVVDQGVSGAAHLVRLEQALGVDLPYGAIIGIPREHQILAVPIRKAGDVAAIEAMLRLVRDVGSQASDRLSLDVFWLHQGRLHPLHAESKNGRLEQIFPPPEFRQLLEQLPRD
ncbi:hypothetical protein [Actinoallomurus sp. CA-142502]|uniref:hypothetical protein n=1 Tax=Actinoallomurus sp. CA-142502 TaxID=3239885 RepID=UPI003D8DB759